MRIEERKRFECTRKKKQGDRERMSAGAGVQEELLSVEYKAKNHASAKLGNWVAVGFWT